MTQRKIKVIRTALAAGAVLSLGGAALAQSNEGDCRCEVGFIDAEILALPAPCPHGSPSGTPLRMVEGLPPGSTLDAHFTVDSFFDITYRIGHPTDPDGQVQQYQGQMTLQMQGTGALQGFSRTLSTQVQFETHTAPATENEPFETEMISMQLALPPGDPDFSVLRLTAGEVTGLPGGGHTTLTELPTGNWNVDSFFDITYQIEFQGAPGSVLEGMGGTTTAAVDYGNNLPGLPPCEIPTPNAGFDAHPFPCPLYPPSGAPINIPTGNPDIQLHGNWNVDSFFDITYRITPDGGQMYAYSGVMHLNIGSSGLDGYTRNVDATFTSCFSDAPGAAEGGTEMVSLNIALPPGDPDFDLLRIVGGSQTGLPAPGQVELTQLPTGNFNVDSFFDITYQIDFQGAPGGALEGLGGSEAQSLRMQQGAPVPTTVTAHGLQNTSMCNTDIALNTDGHLVISNIGSSGCDGVSIDLGDSDGFGTELALPWPEGVFWDLIWLDPDPTAQVKWCLGMQRSGFDSFFDITVDAYEPQEIRVTMLNDHLPVADHVFIPPYPEHLVVSNIGSSGKDGVRQSCAHTSRVDSFFDITYTIDFDASFPGQPPVSCDQLRFEVVAPAGTTAPTGSKEGQCRVVWAGLPPCPPAIVAEESLHLQGAPHVALGQATMSASGDHLTISNIGSSGCDGVSIDCPCLPCPPQCYCHPGWELDWGPPLPPGSSVFGDIVILVSDATGGVVEAKAACLRMDGTQGGTGMGFDPASLGLEPSSIRVSLFDAGVPAGDHVFIPPYPQHLVVSNIGSSGKDGVSIDVGESRGIDDDCDGDGFLRVRNPFPTETQFPGQPIVTADEIRFCFGPGSQPFPESIQRVEFRGLDIPSIVIRDRFDVAPPPCPGDTNGDDNVDVNDLNNVILDWGTDGSANGGDITGPVPGSPPDGFVDVNDLNAVIVGWGPCTPPAAQAPAPKPKRSKPAARKKGARRTR